MGNFRMIAIDGACRGNGTPKCYSAGGVYIQDVENNVIVDTQAVSTYEMGSTNQRGELHALILALDYVKQEEDYETFIVTDSDYLFKSVTCEWSKRWANTGWQTAEGKPVANKDLWELVNAKIYSSVTNGIMKPFQPMYYHIKGHLMTFGKVTAATLLVKDPTGRLLYDSMVDKYTSIPTEKKYDLYTKAVDCSEKIMGYAYDTDTLQKFTCLNMVADAIATQCVEKVKALQS